MAGKYVERGGETLPARSLHVGAKLGFHSPYIDPTLLDNRPYTKDELLAAHEAAAVAIRGAIKLFNYGIQEGAVSGVAKPWVRPSLFIEMLSRGPQELYLVDTVFKAGRWGIDLVGFQHTESFDIAAMRRACVNFHAWEADLEAPMAPQFFEPVGKERGVVGWGVRLRATYNQGRQDCVVTPIVEDPRLGVGKTIGFNIYLQPGSDTGAGVHRPLWYAAEPDSPLFRRP
jgi:hypothetical protein